jgi:hypothetical protein
MAEALGTVHVCGMGLFRERWWPVGRKLAYGQMAAPVPEIMDNSGTDFSFWVFEHSNFQF